MTAEQLAQIIYDEMDYDGDNFSQHLAETILRKTGLHRQNLTCEDGKTVITRLITRWEIAPCQTNNP